MPCINSLHGSSYHNRAHRRYDLDIALEICERDCFCLARFNTVNLLHKHMTEASCVWSEWCRSTGHIPTITINNTIILKEEDDDNVDHGIGGMTKRIKVEKVDEEEAIKKTLEEVAVPVGERQTTPTISSPTTRQDDKESNQLAPLAPTQQQQQSTLQTPPISPTSATKTAIAACNEMGEKSTTKNIAEKELSKTSTAGHRITDKSTTNNPATRNQSSESLTAEKCNAEKNLTTDISTTKISATEKLSTDMSTTDNSITNKSTTDKTTTDITHMIDPIQSTTTTDVIDPTDNSTTNNSTTDNTTTHTIDATQNTRKRRHSASTSSSAHPPTRPPKRRIQRDGFSMVVFRPPIKVAANTFVYLPSPYGTASTMGLRLDRPWRMPKRVADGEARLDERDSNLMA